MVISPPSSNSTVTVWLSTFWRMIFPLPERVTMCLPTLGRFFFKLHVGGILVGQAAHQAATDAGDLCRIEGQVLLLGHFDGDQIESIHKLGATELPSATPDAANHLGLIPHADLPHLNPHLEFCSQIPDQFPEINPLFRGEVKEGFRAVQEDLRLDQLHVHALLLDLLKTEVKGLLLQLPVSLKLLQVFRGGLPGHLSGRFQDETPLLFVRWRKNLPQDRTLFLYSTTTFSPASRGRSDGIELLAFPLVSLTKTKRIIFSILQPRRASLPPRLMGYWHCSVMASMVWWSVSIRFKREERLHSLSHRLHLPQEIRMDQSFEPSFNVFTMTRSLKRVLATSRIKSRFSRWEGNDSIQPPSVQRELILVPPILSAVLLLESGVSLLESPRPFQDFLRKGKPRDGPPSRQALSVASAIRKPTGWAKD